MTTHLAPGDPTTIDGIGVMTAGAHADVDVETLRGADPVLGLAARLVRAGTPQGPALRLAVAADRIGLRPDLAVPVTVTQHVPGAAAALRLEDVVPPEGEGQVALRADADGVLAWHLPQDGRAFSVPLSEGRPAGTTVLVLRFGLPDLAAGAATRLVSVWEGLARPYAVRRVDRSGVLDGTPDTEGWDRLAAGPALLLVHGAFSTARATFADLFAAGGPAAGLLDGYDGRVVAFDHPSLTPDPVENARRLLAEVPAGLEVLVDVVSHSRGGLVGRALPLLGDTRLRVRRHVHVATPNDGTVLADPRRWVTLLDVLTNLAADVEGEQGEGGTLPGVLVVVAQLATGVLDGLDGLAALQPGSVVLERLRAAGEAGQRAAAQITVAADVEPGAGVVGALNELVDRFFGEPNDLVVPTAGTARLPGLDPADAVVLPDMPLVTHTGYFRDERVRRLLLDGLSTA